MYSIRISAEPLYISHTHTHTLQYVYGIVIIRAHCLHKLLVYKILTEWVSKERKNGLAPRSGLFWTRTAYCILRVQRWYLDDVWLQQVIVILFWTSSLFLVPRLTFILLYIYIYIYCDTSKGSVSSKVQGNVSPFGQRLSETKLVIRFWYTLLR